MLRDYAPILLLVVMVVGFAGVNLLLSDLLGAKRRSVDKDRAYESGMSPEGSARVRLSIHFYLVAVLFILFDVEVIFLVPWAVAARELGPAGFAQVAVFLAVLLVGLVYEWRAGGLEWDR
jgi:NADH-quinone oxidoreductase subunit A